MGLVWEPRGCLSASGAQALFPAPPAAASTSSLDLGSEAIPWGALLLHPLGVSARRPAIHCLGPSVLCPGSR